MDAAMTGFSASAPTLSVGFGAAGPWLTAQVRGELDMATAPALLREIGLLGALAMPPRIALELSGVSFCDSSGINALVRLRRRVSAADGEIVLLRPGPRLVRLLARTGVDQCLPVRESLPDGSGPGPDPH